MAAPTHTGPEARLIAWLLVNAEVARPVTRQLPDDVFSPQAHEIIRAIRDGKVSSPLLQPNGTTPYTDDEAFVYIRKQLASLLAREAGRAAKSGTFQKVSWVYDCLESTTKQLEPLPISNYTDSAPVLREVIPTGIDRIDAQIRGLARGEFGFIFAPPGRGKTLFLINFAVSALLNGFSVLYITVADQSKDELVPRLDTRILQIPFPEVYTDAILADRHAQAMGGLAADCWIADFTDRQCTMADVEHAIAGCTSDLVIVDHADDIVSPYSDNPDATRHSLRTVYLGLKQMARRYNVPLWTASQSSELSWSMRSVHIADLSEAKVGKSTGASIILGFSGGPLVEQSPTFVLCTIAKARRIVRDRFFPLHVDQSLGLVW